MLTATQLEELQEYADGEPRRAERPPNDNLIRRNLLTSTRATHGVGTYRITPLGRSTLALALGEHSASRNDEAVAREAPELVRAGDEWSITTKGDSEGIYLLVDPNGTELHDVTITDSAEARRLVEALNGDGSEEQIEAILSPEERLAVFDARTALPRQGDVAKARHAFRQALNDEMPARGVTRAGAMFAADRAWLRTEIER